MGEERFSSAIFNGTFVSQPSEMMERRRHGQKSQGVSSNGATNLKFETADRKGFTGDTECIYSDALVSLIRTAHARALWRHLSYRTSWTNRVGNNRKVLLLHRSVILFLNEALLEAMISMGINELCF